jgi:hypothetical protein
LLLRALYFAGTVLGVDDNVIFFKIHPSIVRDRRVKPTICAHSAHTSAQESEPKGCYRLRS